ncbi:short-chain dehydrogenase [Mycolicibacterium phlei]|uniref:SDR family oxidoreductase n=1 Tax=Mycobacteroides chelonae TaxID=1774 RepID=UPI000618ADF3|nr:SDR family oxidoreductase [Mycobacteroides chelonae]VEG20539.1 short-chain dehydrogenase [Mycolicibacterium phlei]AKC40850.1 short-chain dehydrogenase [Mycobacteroides chelonae]ANB00583.1 short-chain dehydrogenase [Mycobacteroides chelonae CCUG 47445]OLT81708.1 short-chain dehydrogenase [Mycobacteroides chelonae]ORV14473.1 short-chain dehydrogenase [Mycobacteroides chelonae]
MGVLDGRVALITGAGRGIGREHALLFADEGATVVVNDLGGSNSGEGSDEGPAHEVVETIRANGGTAVVNTSNVATWEGAKELVEQAVSEFGHLDIVVNNAGILRDTFIPAMAESEWDAVLAVHLKGHFAVIHHAANYWKARSKAGDQPNAAVVNTASGSGLTLPNAGQANYGAAKAGIAALTLIAAEELDRYGVRVNAIAPIARTRLTLATPGMGALMAEPEDGEPDLFSPANISPLVAYLASDKCAVTGQVYAVQGGAISQLQGWHDVETIETDEVWQIEDIAVRLPH